ncbi:MAG: glycosyltransferase family 4 protein [Acidobacteria bacterium]|nr:glycosyltransferase family 4 protein [Acidobacteriota bacterium]
MKPIRIAIDATSAVTGGGMTHLLNLLPALADIDQANTYWILLSSWQTGMELDLPSRFKVKRIHFPKPTKLCRLAWQQFVLPIFLARRGVDALLSPTDVAPLLGVIPTVLGIRNPNPYWGPEATTRLGRIRESVQPRLTRFSARKATRLFFVTEYSRQVISSKLGLPLNKSRVIYHGVSRAFSDGHAVSGSLQSFEGSHPYILCVSAVRVHKDYATLIRAFKDLVSRHSVSHHLVIAGPVVDPPYYQRLESMLGQEGVADRVHFIGELPYRAMPGLYRDAELFVLPSQAETFGHPLVEAMASGLPVITTDLPVSREICHDAASYFPPGDPRALADKMHLLLSDAGARDALAASGLKRALDFSWTKTAQQTLQLLYEAVNSRE